MLVSSVLPRTRGFRPLSGRPLSRGPLPAESVSFSGKPIPTPIVDDPRAVLADVAMFLRRGLSTGSTMSITPTHVQDKLAAYRLTVMPSAAAQAKIATAKPAQPLVLMSVPVKHQPFDTTQAEAAAKRIRTGEYRALWE